MSSFRVYTLTSFPKSLLAIFYTAKNAYQFRVVTKHGQIFGMQEIYSTKQEAEEAAINCLLKQNLLEN